MTRSHVSIHWFVGVHSSKHNPTDVNVSMTGPGDACSVIVVVIMLALLSKQMFLIGDVTITYLKILQSSWY